MSRLCKWKLSGAICASAILATNASAEVNVLSLAKTQGSTVEATGEGYFYRDQILDRSTRGDPVGKYSTGQRFCSVGGSKAMGWVEIARPDGTSMFAKGDPEFRVIASKTGCPVIPDATVVSSAEVTRKNLDDALNTRVEPMDWFEMGAFLYAIIAATVYVTARRARQPGNKARLWEKNSKDYSYNPNTGEWEFVIRKASDGSEIVYGENRSQRLINESMDRMRLVFVEMVIFLVSILFLIWGSSTFHIQNKIGPMIILGIGVVLFVIAAITERKYQRGGKVYLQPKFIGMVIDPPPRRAASQPFGPETAAGQTAAPDLAYKPNA